MKNGPFTALIAGLTAVIVGGGVAIAYEVVVVPNLVEEAEFQQREAAFLREDLLGFGDSYEGCMDLLDLRREQAELLEDAYEIRAEASDVFFTRGDFYAGDADELFYQFGRADRLATDYFALTAAEEDAYGRCTDLSFMVE